MKKRIFNMHAYIGNVSHPIGSIYTELPIQGQTQITSPHVLFGGKASDWERIKGAFLFAKDPDNEKYNQIDWQIHGADSQEIDSSFLVRHTHTAVINPSTAEAAWSSYGLQNPELLIEGEHGDIKITALGSEANADFGVPLAVNDPSEDVGFKKLNWKIQDTHSHTVEVDPRGGEGKTFDKMPPYMIVNMWRRIGLAPVYTEEVEELPAIAPVKPTGVLYVLKENNINQYKIFNASTNQWEDGHE